MSKIKTCKKCHYYTGIKCHGHGDYWGECKKNKNTLYCYDDTPCLQDIKTLQNLYYEQNSKIHKLESEVAENSTYKTRYEIQTRRIEKLKISIDIAKKYIPKENYKKFNDEIIKTYFK